MVPCRPLLSIPLPPAREKRQRRRGDSGRRALTGGRLERCGDGGDGASGGRRKENRRNGAAWVRTGAEHAIAQAGCGDATTPDSRHLSRALGSLPLSPSGLFLFFLSALRTPCPKLAYRISVSKGPFSCQTFCQENFCRQSGSVRPNAAGKSIFRQINLF